MLYSTQLGLKLKLEFRLAKRQKKTNKEPKKQQQQQQVNKVNLIEKMFEELEQLSMGITMKHNKKETPGIIQA